MAWVASGCANLGTPPGGPERTTPPEILSVTPDSGAVNVRVRNVEFRFDVVVSDRGGASGALDDLFLVSPGEGRPRVRWRRSRIEVRPRRGFRPNTAYSVTLRPGIADLRGNAQRAGRTIIFSTGPRIPQFAVHGRAFEWMQATIAPNALIEVIRKSDSLPYWSVSDSTGQFAVGPLEEGAYLVRAILDTDRDRGLDPLESWDSVSVVVRGSSPFVELLAAPRDTVAPRLLTVSTPDSLTLGATFDRPLDPSQPFSPSMFRVVAADSTPLRVVSVMTRAQADSVRAASDTTRRDTIPRTDTTRARRDTGRARPDTLLARVAAAQLKPSRPTPPREVVLRLDSLTPLRRGITYRVTASRVRGLLGHSRTSDRPVTLSAVRPDTTRGARPAPTRALPPTPTRPPSRPPS